MNWGCAFKDDWLLSKECGALLQPCGNNTVVFPQASKQHISNFHDWCLPHKKKDNYCLWELHDLNLSFRSHTYTTVNNASKWRYIILYHVFSSKVGFLLGICNILNQWLPLFWGSAFSSWIICVFLWVRPPLLNIISYYNTRLRPFHKGYKNMRKVQFPPLATSPSQ